MPRRLKYRYLTAATVVIGVVEGGTDRAVRPAALRRTSGQPGGSGGVRYHATVDCAAARARCGATAVRRIARICDTHAAACVTAHHRAYVEIDPKESLTSPQKRTAETPGARRTLKTDCDGCTAKHAFEDAIAPLSLRTLRLGGDIPFVQWIYSSSHKG
jgi:hypothetical protein